MFTALGQKWFSLHLKKPLGIVVNKTDIRKCFAFEMVIHFVCVQANKLWRIRLTLSLSGIHILHLNRIILCCLKAFWMCLRHYIATS